MVYGVCLEDPYDAVADCRVGAPGDVHEGVGAEEGDILVVAGLPSPARSPQCQVKNLLPLLTLWAIIHTWNVVISLLILVMGRGGNSELV